MPAPDEKFQKCTFCSQTGVWRGTLAHMEFPTYDYGAVPLTIAWEGIVVMIHFSWKHARYFNENPCSLFVVSLIIPIMFLFEKKNHTAFPEDKFFLE